MSDTAETLLREHLKLCSETYQHGLVPTKEVYWAGGDREYTLCYRWYYHSDLKRRTEALLAVVGAAPSRDAASQGGDK